MPGWTSTPPLVWNSSARAFAIFQRVQRLPTRFALLCCVSIWGGITESRTCCNYFPGGFTSASGLLILARLQVGKTTCLLQACKSLVTTTRPHHICTNCFRYCGYNL